MIMVVRFGRSCVVTFLALLGCLTSLFITSRLSSMKAMMQAHSQVQERKSPNERNEQYDANITDLDSDQVLSSQAQERVFPQEQYVNITTLDPDQVLFLHIGKSGGGSIEERFRLHWGLKVPVCHPKPCNGPQKHHHQATAKMIISIRDPVDRFLSAFYWRLVVLCHPDRHLETRIAGPNATQNLQKLCKPGAPGEAFGLHYTFQKNASLLAEALCQPPDNDNDKENNGTIFPRGVPQKMSHATFFRASPWQRYIFARRFMKQKIQHIRHGISDWLKFALENTADPLPRIFPIVLENAPDDDTAAAAATATATIPTLEEQVDEAVAWLAANMSSSFSSSSSSSSLPKGLAVLLQKRNLTNNTFGPDVDSHAAATTAIAATVVTSFSAAAASNATSSSSSSASKHSSADVKQPLTPQGEACVKEYFRSDYLLLKDLQRQLCKTPGCMAGMDSILKRRGFA